MKYNNFQLISKMQPQGDQPKAIQALVDGLNDDMLSQTLMGVTGSGKTFTIANVIQKIQKPTLVIAHNKTLAAQLYNEFKELFPNNAVAVMERVGMSQNGSMTAVSGSGMKTMSDFSTTA